MSEFDFGILIPLAEEFGAFAEHFEAMTPLIGNWPAIYYEVDVAGHRAVARQMSTMGIDAAAIDTTQMVRDFAVSLIFVLGLGGSLDPDVLVGDVVAASQIDDYLHMSKATSDKGSKTYQLALSGEAFPGHFALREAVSNFRTLNPPEFKGWQVLAEGFLRTHVDLDELPESVRSLIHCPPQLHLGHMASGPTVGASAQFREMLRDRDRKYLAIEMEGSGAARALDRMASGRVAIIRGISDLAGPEKERLDSGTPAEAPGVWRQYALHNLFSFFRVLVGDSWFTRQLRGENPRSDQEGTQEKASPSAGLDSAGRVPQPRTRFFGRDGDVGAVQSLLSTCQLVTIVGTPGVGKSRLAVEVGRNLNDAFFGQVFFVELAQISDPRLVLSRIAEAVGLRELPGNPLLDTLQRALAGRPVILLLDNCEHVLDAGQDVTRLLDGCPQLLVLATSLAPMNLVIERTYGLGPLPVPTATELDFGTLLTNPAVALFIDRASTVAPSFRLTATNSKAIVELCNRFDGLPLALELAAPWMRVLSVQEYLDRQDQIDRLPNRIPKGDIGRHASLRAAFLSSYTLLKPAEQALFCRLSVFQGGADLAAVEAIDLGTESTLATIAELINMRLVERLDDHAGHPRFTQRPPLQRFALEELENLGEEVITKDSHADYFARRSETAAPLLRSSEQILWLTQLELDHGNLRAALDWLETSGRPINAVFMANALTRFWYVHGHLDEGKRRFEALLQGNGTANEPWTSAHMGAGLLSREMGDFTSGRSHLKVAVRDYGESGDQRNKAEALYHLGVLEERDQRLGPAQRRFRESLSAAKRVDDDWVIASAWRGLSHVAVARGQYEAAGKALEQSLEHFRLAGDPRGLAISLRFSSEIAIDLEVFGLARLQLRECLAILSELDDAWSINNALLAMARLEAAEGSSARALRLEGAAEELRSGIGAVLPVADRARIDRSLTGAREAFIDAEQHALFQEGASMTLTRAIEYALDEKGYG